MALVVVLAVVGAYVEGHPTHVYAGLHLKGPPPAAAFLILAFSALALVGRSRYPVGVFAVTTAAAVGWAAVGQIDGAALVPVIVATYAMALRCPRLAAVVAGLAGTFAIWLAEGLLGPFGWLGGPNATMWPELLAAALSARTWVPAGSGSLPRLSVPSRPNGADGTRPDARSTPNGCASPGSSTTRWPTPWQ